MSTTTAPSTMPPPRRPRGALLALLALSAPSPGGASPNLVDRARRALDARSTFGSATSAPSYERVSSMPVFAVTTPWGSPYLIFERTDEDDMEGDGGGGKQKEDFGDVMGPEQSARQVVLYFADPSDAAAHRDEMVQLEAMKGADMRIMATSMGRAVRQASNLGNGLPTGQPVDDLTGKMKGPDEGGLLRYKIVPSRRELFYAARCRGRERVGLFGESPASDASVMSNSRKTVAEYVGGLKAAREDRLKGRRGSSGVDGSDALRVRYEHMEGGLGVPVFHCPGLKRRHPSLKRLINSAAAKSETPLFFSYEDMEESWKELREASDESAKAGMPVTPPGVEVYNLMDVVSSIDKDQWRVKRRGELRWERRVDGALGMFKSVPLVNKLVKGAGEDKVAKKEGGKGFTSGLEQVTFVPSSRNVAFKDEITETGNSKARLRRMREWGREAM